jgi:hypothetical protein
VGAVGKSWRETTICNKISMPNLRSTHLQITVACAAERMPNLRSLFDPSKHPELVGNLFVVPQDFKIQYICLNFTDGSNLRKIINLKKLLQRKSKM